MKKLIGAAILWLLWPSLLFADTSSIKGLISFYALKFDVSEVVMTTVVGCETGHTFDPLIQSTVVDKTGRREPSFGLAQIDLDFWPYITKDNAINPDFSLAFLASQLSMGNGHYWTCYNTHYGK